MKRLEDGKLLYRKQKSVCKFSVSHFTYEIIMERQCIFLIIFFILKFQEKFLWHIYVPVSDGIEKGKLNTRTICGGTSYYRLPTNHSGL